MTTPSPLCLINGTTPLDGYDSSPGDSVVIQLTDPTGVYAWSLQCIGTDETNDAATITAGVSIDQATHTATFTAPTEGSALIFQSVVNNGRDNNGSIVAAYTTTVGVFVPMLSDGQRVGALNETTEGDHTFGWLSKLNGFFRTGGGGGSTTFGEDLSAVSSVAQKVVGLQGVPLASTTPVTHAVPVYSGSSYAVRQLTLDDIADGFSISTFSGGSTVEVGATVTNPAFTASYSSTPTSAAITNTDGTDSPRNLITPFTSGTVTGSFHKTSAATVTFTLTAISTSTKTATSSIAFQARSFGGVGSAGAASATASGTTAVLDSSHGTLSSLGLHSTDTGQSYGPFSPTAQKIYLLLPHTASPHTFSAGGFSFPMNAPTTFTFPNANSANISMDLYESTNSLSTPFTILVS